MKTLAASSAALVLLVGCADQSSQQAARPAGTATPPSTSPVEPTAGTGSEQVAETSSTAPPVTPAVPAGPADAELSLLSVRHADGRPLALLANYGVHYIGGYEGGHVSADYFGAFSERMRELLGGDSFDPPFVAMMSNGTSGDTNNINFNS